MRTHPATPNRDAAVADPRRALPAVTRGAADSALAWPEGRAGSSGEAASAVAQHQQQSLVMPPVLPQVQPPPQTAAQAQTLRSVARLSSGFSHDFNNLLQVLRNMLELIQQRPGEAQQVAGWAESALRIVDRGAQRAAQLVAFTGTQQLSPQTVQVQTMLQRLQPRLQDLLGPHSTLQLHQLADTTLATADPAQLEQAVLNLAHNAADAMPHGGTLTITPGRVHVEDDAELATGDYVAIDVADTGTGMSGTVRDRAFEPFFTTKALGRGSGLGLSQVHGFLRQTGGAVRILPPAGRGSTVRMLLPAAAPPAPPAGLLSADVTSTATAGKQPARRQPQVLVVVDDPQRRQMLLSALNLQGYDDVQAVDAVSARAQLAVRAPDVVVLGLPARPVGPDDLARRARRLRPGVGVVRLDALATAPELALDIDAVARAIDRAVPPPRPT